MKCPRLVTTAWSRTSSIPSLQHFAQRGKQTAWPCSILARSIAIMNLHFAQEDKQDFKKEQILITYRPETITVPNSQKRFGCRPLNVPKWRESDVPTGEVRGQRAAESPTMAIKANVAFSVQNCRAHSETEGGGGCREWVQAFLATRLAQL